MYTPNTEPEQSVSIADEDHRAFVDRFFDDLLADTTRDDGKALSGEISTSIASNWNTPPLSIEREFSSAEIRPGTSVIQCSEADFDEPALVHLPTPSNTHTSTSTSTLSTPAPRLGSFSDEHCTRPHLSPSLREMIRRAHAAAYPTTTTPPTTTTTTPRAATLTITTRTSTGARKTLRASVGTTPWRTLTLDQMFRLACRSVASRNGVAFTLNIAPKVAARIVRATDPASYIAARINAEMRKIGHTANELAFRFEVSSSGKLHLHGVLLVDAACDPAKITAALRRAGGKVSGALVMTQAHAQPITDADGWADYACKPRDRRRAEALLPGKALAYVSRAARAAAKTLHEGARPKATRTCRPAVTRPLARP